MSLKRLGTRYFCDISQNLDCRERNSEIRPMLRFVSKAFFNLISALAFGSNSNLELVLSSASPPSCADLLVIEPPKIDLNLELKKPRYLTRSYTVKKAEINFRKAMEPWLNWDSRKPGVGSFGIDENPDYVFVQGLKSHGSDAAHAIAIVKKDTGKTLHLRLRNDTEYSSTVFLGERDGRLFFSNTKSGVFYSDLNQPNFTVLGHPVTTQVASVLQSGFDNATGPISPYSIPAKLETNKVPSQIEGPNFNDTNVIAASIPSGNTGFVLKRTDTGQGTTRVSTFQLVKYQWHETGNIIESEISKFDTSVLTRHPWKAPVKLQAIGPKLYFVTEFELNKSLMSFDLGKANEVPKIEIPGVMRDPIQFSHKGTPYLLVEGTDDHLSIWNPMTGITGATTQIPNLNQAMGYSFSGDGLLRIVFHGDAKVIDLKDFFTSAKDFRHPIK